MSVHAAPTPGDGLALTVRGRVYPVVLPKLRDPRLQLAATITSLQVIGQVGFRFQLSIAQILIALGTCAVLEIAIALRKQGVLLWPASALLTGNGVAFVLRVPGTAHGDWWSLRGWWIFAGTAALALLSKHVLAWRGKHVFNPSNIGLVVCFLALGRARAAPLDFWWGPMSTWLAIALGVILVGGFTILSRLSLLRVAIGFWLSFAASIAILAAAGHAMTARWHLGPVSGFHFWAVLVTSPEVLVFLFFMITDPKTAPTGGRARVVYAISLGLLAGLLIAPTTTEFASKVALLGALAIVCLAMPVVRRMPLPRLSIVVPVAAATYVVLLVAVTATAPSVAAPAAARDLPPIEIAASHGVQSRLDTGTARRIATDFVRAVSAAGPMRVWLEPGTDQGPPLAVVEQGGMRYVLHQAAGGRWVLGGDALPPTGEVAPPAPRASGFRLRNVAASSGIDFRQGSFRFGMSNDPKAMMGGGVCWIDYNADGWLDLFAVNSYSSADAAQWEAHGGLPRTALYENLRGRFHNVSRAAHAGLAVQGDGCVAADLDGDGRTDLVVTTASGIDVLWNRGGTFREAALPASGWYTGAAVADVNGDGRPDLFVAGYADPNEPVAGSFAGFPTNVAGVRDLLFLNEGDRRFREAGVQAGLESTAPSHGLGATFTDVNGDGRPDLYVANDEDPNELYVDVPWPGGAAADPAGLGFRFEERAVQAHVADPFAGMGIATTAAGAQLLVTNSRHEPTAVYRRRGSTYAEARGSIDRALGTGFAGWGASFVDLANSGKPALVLAAGAIPVTKLAADKEPVRVLGPLGAGYGNAAGDPGLTLNGRGLAAADVANDGRMDVAINTIGGGLVLLRPRGPRGHWLDVELSRFEPGSVVTAVLPGGRRLVGDVQAGGSYLSSEDPRVHLGLGAATHVTALSVRFPGGARVQLHDVAADRVVSVAVPKPTPTPDAAPSPCAATSLHGRSLATYWNRAALAMLRTSGLSEPVQARDLLDLSLTMRTAYRRDPAAIDAAAYRLLVWHASFGSNLARSFAILGARLRARCPSPSAAVIGNRIADRAIAAGERDGSLESLHYVDASFAPVNAPLVLSRAGSTAHDASFWQPLALGEVAAHGLAGTPAKVQRFVAAQWGSRDGGVRAVSSPPATPSDEAYKLAAVAVIRATAAGASPQAAGTSPLAWNQVADALPSRGLERDLDLQVTLNRALDATAISVWRVKRSADAPRPISMIRYLSFQGQSSDRGAASYSADGLPLVRGLIELRGKRVLVRSQGRWVPGSRWTPPAATPASPGGVSERSAFDAAAASVLHTLTGRTFARHASGVALGIDTPADEAAGRALGQAVAGRLLR